VIVFVQAIALSRPPDLPILTSTFSSGSAVSKRSAWREWWPNTWIEGTTRCAGELGYQVTLVPDATAAHMAEEAGLSVWLSAYRYSRLKAGVTPSNALPDDPRMISGLFATARGGARQGATPESVGEGDTGDAAAFGE
jgi:hypothetical protein